MSTDVDPYAEQNEMDGLVNVAPDRAMTEAEVAALGDVPDMVAVPDIDRISQDGLRNQNVDQIDGMSPVSLDGSKKQSRFERMAEVAYDQSPELQEQLGRVLPQLEESQQRMIADRERTKDIPSWVSTLPGSDPIIEDSSIDAALENAYDVARKYSINSVLSLTNAGLTVFASDPVLDVFNVVAGGFPLIDSEEETAQFNTHMKDMYDAGGTPHEGYEVSYREWRWLGQNNTDETYKFTINGNMIDTVAYGSEFPLSNGKPGRSAMVLPNEVDDLMGLGNVTINPNNGRMYQDTYDFDNHTVKESDLLLKQMYETVRNHLNVKAAKDNAGINGVSIKFKVNFDYDGNYWKREVE
jgi:hypothetical protein